MKLILSSLAIVFLLTGCATSLFTTSTLATFTHADLQNAAAIATKNGYPARAAIWTSYDQLLTSAEAQVQACKDAIIASLKQIPTTVQGVATITELSSEALVGATAGSVKAACTPMPLPVLPPLPKP